MPIFIHWKIFPNIQGNLSEATGSIKSQTRYSLLYSIGLREKSRKASPWEQWENHPWRDPHTKASRFQIVPAEWWELRSNCASLCSTSGVVLNQQKGCGTVSAAGRNPKPKVEPGRNGQPCHPILLYAKEQTNNCAFKGKGKRTPLKKLEKKPRYQESFAKLGDSWEITDELVCEL